jgi:prepilin-type N-terminal cleavage/methylation domain-containing protein
MNLGDKRGFTLVELMIVAVVGAMVVAATYQILLSSQRALTVQTAQVQGRQAVRAGLDILTSELREISRSEGDIINMAPNRVEVRAMRTFGLVCGVNPTGNPIRVQRVVGSWFEDGDSVMIFADNDPDLARDDTILAGLVSSVDKTQTCLGGGPGELLNIPALEVAASVTEDTVRVGAPVRGFTRYTYGLYSVDGDDYLARRSGVTIAPLVGPLAPNGVAFTYVDSLGNVTTNPRNVSRIDVTLRTRSSVLNQRGLPVEDSLSSAIYLRN